MRASLATTIDKRRERLFYTAMAALFGVIVFAGFARTYYLGSYFGAPELDWVRHAHGVIFSTWLVLLLAQTLLVANGRTDLHRRLGVSGLVIAAAMIAIGTWTALVRARAFALPPGSPPPLAFLTIPLGDLVVFATLFGLAYRWRRHAASHKRLMLLATIAILPAAVARLPFGFIQAAGPVAFFGLADLLIVVCATFDWRTLGKVHPVTLWGGLLIVVSHPLRLIIGTTAGWLVFAEWLTGWVE